MKDPVVLPARRPAPGRVSMGSEGMSGYVNDTIRRALASAGLMTTAAKTRVQGPSGVVAREPPGQFICRSYSNPAGTRDYKLYIPKSFTGEPMPLIVMLHGCTQSPDDFAIGTRMNALADRRGFFVAYPAQSARANGANCWNWFSPAHQATDGGEPSLIAGITREVASIYPVDDQRIYVAGLSAGAAMAVILGATHPALFAAVGAHSGLAYGAAYDLPSALAAMRGNAPPLAEARTAPTIVFHGDRDTTVSAVNGAAIVSQAIGRGPIPGGELRQTVQKRRSANGREYTATIYRDSTSRPRIEHWVVHGAGHAWSGGSADGSYTDATGPDASVEMVRFFLAQSLTSEGDL